MAPIPPSNGQGSSGVAAPFLPDGAAYDPQYPQPAQYAPQYPPASQPPPGYPSNVGPGPYIATGVPAYGTPVDATGGYYPFPPPPPAAPQPGSSNYAYPQQHPATSEPVVVICSHKSSVPHSVQCPWCKHNVTPMSQKESGCCTWLAAGALCLFGCWFLSCLPFCCKPMKDSVYRCPRCDHELYRVSPA